MRSYSHQDRFWCHRFRVQSDLLRYHHGIHFQVRALRACNSEPTLTQVSRYGILIEQNYDGGDLKGEATSGVPITDLTIEGITGTGAVSSSGYDVVIVCGSSGCSDWTWSDVSVTGGKTYSSCENVPSVTSCS